MHPTKQKFPVLGCGFGVLGFGFKGKAKANLAKGPKA